MKSSEFKAWFDGFSENIDGQPNAKQWKRIKARVEDIDGESITPTVIREYVDRYLPRPYRSWPYWSEPYITYKNPSFSCGNNVASVSDTLLSVENAPNFTDNFTVTSCLAAMGAEEATRLSAPEGNGG